MNRFEKNKDEKKSIVSSAIGIENLKPLKYHIFLKKQLVLFIICNKCGSKD